MADNFDLRPHQETWNGFCKLMLYSSIGVVVVLVLMALFLT